MRVSAKVTGFKEAQRLIKAHPQIAKKVTIQSGEKTARRSIDLIVRQWRPHKKTGGLEFGNTWAGKIMGKIFKWEVFNQVHYSRFIETGRREVRPVRAKVLRWIGPSGKPVYAMRSKATKPDPAYQNAYKRFIIGWPVRLKNQLQAAFNKAAKK